MAGKHEIQNILQIGRFGFPEFEIYLPFQFVRILRHGSGQVSIFGLRILVHGVPSTVLSGRAGAKNIRIRESSPPGKFAQAAETFNESSTRFLLTARRQAI